MRKTLGKIVAGIMIPVAVAGAANLSGCGYVNDKNNAIEVSRSLSNPGPLMRYGNDKYHILKEGWCIISETNERYELGRMGSDQKVIERQVWLKKELEKECGTSELRRQKTSQFSPFIPF